MNTTDQSSKPIRGSVNHSYALNGRIMLSSVIVLFVALILILCFHSYARWLFRRQNRRIRRRVRAHLRSLYARDPALAPSFAPLDPAVLKKIPVFVYALPKNTDAPPLECTVCLSEFEENDEGRVLPKCGHAFHVDCIDTWFRSSSTCPLCRAGIQPSNPEQPTSETTEPTAPVCEPVKQNENSEAGRSSSPEASSSSSPVVFPPVRCPRQPIELVGIVVEMPEGI